MGRDKSRSPRRRRSRSRSKGHHRDRSSHIKKDRNHDREKKKERHRSNSRSKRRRSRSRSRERLPDGRLKHYVRKYSTSSSSSDEVKKESRAKKEEIDEKMFEGKSQEEIDMIKMMGFGSFDSTKGKHVEGNDIYVANIQKKRKYRQYMNRRGGFNRPLDHVD